MIFGSHRNTQQDSNSHENAIANGNEDVEEGAIKKKNKIPYSQVVCDYFMEIERFLFISYIICIYEISHNHIESTICMYV
jgi:hypothetical protein